MANTTMMFPNTVREFMEQFKMVDTEQIYSNGIEYVPIFRMEQWFAHQADTSRWIPVTDGLPEIGDRALVTIPSIGETFVTIGTYAGEYRWHISDYGFFCEKVIAWSPLPSPYKGGEEE